MYYRGKNEKRRNCTYKNMTLCGISEKSIENLDQRPWPWPFVLLGTQTRYPWYNRHIWFFNIYWMDSDKSCDTKFKMKLGELFWTKGIFRHLRWVPWGNPSGRRSGPTWRHRQPWQLCLVENWMQWKYVNWFKLTLDCTS